MPLTDPLRLWLGSKHTCCPFCALASFESTDPVLCVRAARVRGRALRALGLHAEACAAFHGAAEGAARVGWLRWALPCWEKVVAAAAASGDRKLEVQALVEAAKFHSRLGRRHGASLGMQTHEGIDRAVPLIERAVAIQRDASDHAGAARTLVDAYDARSSSWSLFGEELWDLAPAAVWLERANDIYAELGITIRQIEVVQKMATAYERASAYARSIEWHHVALDLMQQLANKTNVAFAVFAFESFRDLAHMHRRMGDRPGELRVLRRWLDAYDQMEGALRRLRAYPRALAGYERALALAGEMGARAGVGDCHGNLGNVYAMLGDPARALIHYDRARAIAEERGDARQAASVLANIGALHHGAGDVARGIDLKRRSLGIFEDLGDRAGVARALANIGNGYYALGKLRGALDHQERALALSEELGDWEGVARALGNIGLTLVDLGERDRGGRFLDRAIRAARRLRSARLSTLWLTAKARLSLADGESGAALLTALRGLEVVEDLLGGLAEEEAAGARSRHADLFAVGALAAARLGDPAEVVAFLESGRAGSLLETLGGRRALRWTDLPAHLRRLEADSKAREARARYDHARALETKDRRLVRVAARALDDAAERVREVHASVQREAKEQSGLFYPRAATLEEIQGWLDEGEALVLYGLCLDDAIALVLRPDSERIVSLGDVKTVEAACAAIRPLLESSATRGPLGEGEGRTGPKDVDRALAGLKALLVEPLELGDAVDTVLVSPEGPLCYLPWGALFESTVAVTPSGTTHVLLLEEEREPGEGILALGDPDYAGISEGAHAIYYRGRRLTALPSSRAEAEAIGTERLLGADANEEAFATRVAEQWRWRAVHLACHGLIDVKRPMLSSLALSGSKEEDGFLTALEVLRMEIPADLAVLSACETATGKVVKGEGIVGLTRAFMYAGAPRVLCSLWKVDDEATRALMEKFYELWNPEEGEGLPAAEALRRAQGFVRGHEKWKHPYYWAAWVLWGLPD